MAILKRLLFVSALVMLSVQASGTSDSLRFSVRGSVRDAATGRPLDVVSVSIPGTTYATVTNADGTFLIKSDVEPAFVSFSLLGYNSRTLPYAGDEPIRVRMERGDLELDAASVVSGDPLSLLRYAISMIEANSPGEAELFDCFYRETVRKRQRFIYVSEAVTKVYKPLASSRGRDRAAVVKSRLLTSPRPSDTLGVKVVGGPAMAADLDIVRTRSILLDETQLSLYSFELMPSDMIDGRPQFVIRFYPAAERPFALQKGFIYIDRETFAFSRIQTSLDVSDKDKATDAMLISKPLGLRFTPKEMSLVLDYRQEGGKCRLGYLRTEFRFGCDWRRRLLATDYTVVSEMVVTGRHSGSAAVPVSRSEAFGSKVSLADKAAVYADPGFWDDYNIIEPTSSLEHAVERLKKQNR